MECQALTSESPLAQVKIDARPVGQHWLIFRLLAIRFNILQAYQLKGRLSKKQRAHACTRQPSHSRQQGRGRERKGMEDTLFLAAAAATASIVAPGLCAFR